MNNYNQWILAAGMGVSVILAGCGGGGSSSSASSAGSNASALSADQQTFEQFTLAPNASYEVTSGVPVAGTPANGTNYLFESHASMAASPSTGLQALNGSAATSLAKTLSVPVLGGSRYLVNGAIVPAGSDHNISYQGSAIRDDDLSGDGTTVAVSFLRSNLSIVPLSGTVTAAPSEFAEWFGGLFYNPTLLSTAATWNTGAAYLKYTMTYISDTYLVVDYTGGTVGNSPNPVATGTTIAALMSSGGITPIQDGVTYTLSNGSESTINGVTTYVAAATESNSSTTAYRTFYELNGNVYMGSLIKAGAVAGGHLYITATSNGTSTTYTSAYSAPVQIRLNAAATASLSAAVTF